MTESAVRTASSPVPGHLRARRAAAAPAVNGAVESAASACLALNTYFRADVPPMP